VAIDKPYQVLFRADTENTTYDQAHVMKHVAHFPHQIIEDPDMGIVMPDGCRLSARVWMPMDAADDPVPVILEHLPYRKRDGTIVRDQFTHPWLAGHGYACIRTDMRGSGESQGLLDDEYLEQELEDACHVIAWAAAQPWCNGNVGMMGISWGGFNALQVASMQPPALKAVITLCSTVDRYADDIHYKGGCLLLENFGWASNMLSYSSRPPDPALVGDAWKQMWLDRLDHQPWLWSTWMRHQHRDPYWKHGSVCEDFGAITAAVMSIGGWHDGYRNTISHLVENLNAPVKGIVGPWNHKYPHYAGPRPAIGFLQEAKRWWDYWLKGVDTGVQEDPDYRVYVMDSVAPERWFDQRPGRWIDEQEWPSPTISSETLHLVGSGSLDPDPSLLDVVVSSPEDCGSQTGEFFPFAFSDELPDEQSSDDAGSQCFDSAAVTQGRDIVGAPVVEFSLRSNRASAFVAVRLCDIRPDGSSALITFGCLNLTHRLSHEHPTALQQGKSVTVKLVLDQCAYHLPAGHRLRVAISNSYWPLIWPSPKAGEIELVTGSVTLPFRPIVDEEEWIFEEPEGASAWQCEKLRAADYWRRISRNKDDCLTTTIFSDAGENRDLEHGLISGSWCRKTFSIHPDDPLSATCAAHWQQTGGREGAMWRTEAESSMHGDADHFYSNARLRAYLNGEPVFDKQFNDKVARDLV
jgi:putative CocE/NonD family hydrolase